MSTEEEAPLAPKQEERSGPCSNACATLGLDHVVGFGAAVWKNVSHTPFLGCVPPSPAAPRRAWVAAAAVHAKSVAQLGS